MKKIIGLILALLLVTMLPVAAAPDKDIVETAIDNGNFTVLVEALQAADLVDTLQGEGPFTVFAPTDAAFTTLLGDLGITKAELLANKRLTQVLLYHVLSGNVKSTDLTDGMMAETVLGEEVEVSLGPVMINDANVTTADIETTNGTIHVIDKVLVPAAFSIEFDTVVDVALSDDNFSILVQALTKADLVSTLQGDGPFTVFAPTNAAFEALLASLNITAAQLLDHPDLTKVLLYHVVSGKVMSTDITDGLVAETLNAGQNLTFTLGSVIINGDVNVTTADLEALNGVVHVIDTVLVPANFALDSAEVEDLPNTNDSVNAGWAFLVLTLGAGLVIISKSKVAKASN
jgi:transforming growth factor-beta-induced protein